jgi:hypothetical protein
MEQASNVENFYNDEDEYFYENALNPQSKEGIYISINLNYCL